MAISPAITVVIGRHMAPVGGSEGERVGGGGGGPLCEHSNKSESGQLLPPVHTIKDLEQGSGGGEVPKILHFKGLKLFLYLGH